MNYQQAQPYPYAPAPQPMPFMAPPPYHPHGYAPPPPPPPYAPQPYPAPYAYAQPYPAQPDPIDQRLRAYGQAQTAVGSMPGNDHRILNVIDAAVRSTETKTAAAIDALTTLIERQRKADDQRKQNDGTSEVAKMLAALTERLQGLEQSVQAAGEARNEAALTHARELEARIGEALNTLTETRNNARARDFVAPAQADTVTFEAANDSVEPSFAQPEAVAVGVRPPPRAHVRPRITVPRSSLAVAEIAARQRMLDAGVEAPVADEATSQGFDTIRRSIAALSEQVRDTARLRERKNEQELREEIKDLQRSVQELAPRQIVASVNESIRALALKIEQSREDGLRESQLAPLEALLNEMRSNLLELKEPRSLNGVQETLALLARRVETMSERNADAGQLDEIQRQMADMRAVIADARTDQPFEALKGQINLLSDKLDAAAERPRDTRAMLTLAEAVEEMRRAIRKIDPDAVLSKLEARLASLDGLEQRIDALSRRIGERGESPAPVVNLDGIEKRLDALSQRMGETSGRRGEPTGLGDLSERIAQMTHTLAQRAANPDLSPILARIDAMQETIQETMQETIISRPVAETDSTALEGALNRLASRIEDMDGAGQSRGLDTLQTQIMNLANRLDRTPEMPALGGLEATLHDLCHKVASLETVARSSGGEPSIDPLAAEGMVLIKRDLTDMKTAQAEADARQREVLGQVNAALEKIISRLGAIEAEAQRPRAAPQLAPQPQPMVQAAPQVMAQQPVAAPHAHSASQLVPTPPSSQVNAAVANAGRAAPVLSRPVEATPVQAASPRAEPAPQRMEAPPAMRAPAASGTGEGDLDLPLEPGGRAPLDSPLGGGSDARQNFIAAARRAAQAAQEEAAVAMAEAEAAAAGRSRFLPAGLGNVKAALAARRKPLLLGLAAVVVAVGGIKVASQFLDDEVPAQKVAQAPALTMPQPGQAVASDADAAADKLAKAEPSPNEPAQTEPVAIAPQPPRNIPLTADTNAGNVAPGGSFASAPIPGAMDAAGLMKAMSFIPPEKLKQAALAGNASAAYEIGARLAEGRGGATRDLKNAARWMEIAANQGLPLAQYRLGSFHREGLGVSKDNRVAYGLFQKAAEQGNTLAMHNLAVLHAEGVNGAADYGAAAQWFRNAAEHGIKDSQFNIAVLYLQGLGVAPDQMEAYKWFAAAARQGDPEAAKRRDALLAKIPQEKQEAARQLAENFRAKRPDPRANDLVLPEGGWDDKRLPTMAKTRAKAV